MIRIRTGTLFFAIIATLAFAAQSKAANTVSWGAGQPTTAKGQVSGSGTYATDTGWNVTACSLNAIPTAGGLSSTAAGPAPTGGNWGPITIKNLATGQYTVWATVIFKDALGHTQVINSPTSIVNVP